MQHPDNLDSVRQLFSAGAKREIFLIVECGPAHIAKKTRTFVESLKGKLRLYYLPPYAPEFSRRSS